MLMKLLKYDLKNMYKFLVVFYILSIFFALTTRLFFSIDDTTIIKIIGQISVGCMFAMIANIFINNIGIKLCSFILAIVVWAIIINIDDPYKTRTFSVDVETVNESALQSVNKVYEIIEGNTASVKVKGKKSIVDKLDSTDIRATADLSNLSAVNAVPIVPALRKLTSSEVTLECTQVLKVSLENRASKQVKVNVITQGTPEEGFTIGECSAKPNMIEEKLLKLI